MGKTSEKTSTWLALRNHVFRRLSLAMVISGSCIGAHNTAVYWAMHKLGASTLHIALMTTVSALPYTLFAPYLVKMTGSRTTLIFEITLTFTSIFTGKAVEELALPIRPGWTGLIAKIIQPRVVAPWL